MTANVCEKLDYGPKPKQFDVLKSCVVQGTLAILPTWFVQVQFVPYFDYINKHFLFLNVFLICSFVSDSGQILQPESEKKIQIKRIDTG